jgi:hypothetical protein
MYFGTHCFANGPGMGEDGVMSRAKTRSMVRLTCVRLAIQSSFVGSFRDELMAAEKQVLSWLLGLLKSQHLPPPLGCWAHVRRKFNEAVKAQGKRAPGKAGKAQRGLALIQRLYRIERELKALTPEARYQARQHQARPVLDELRAWLDQSLPQVAPQSATGKALNYLHNQWDKLVRYLDDGRLPIDNNRTENAIRPFVLGRKNWLFSDTVAGARARQSL